MLQSVAGDRMDLSNFLVLGSILLTYFFAALALGYFRRYLRRQARTTQAILASTTAPVVAARRALSGTWVLP